MQVGAPDRDATLVAASSRGDRAAYAEIIERYQRAVYAVSYSGVRDRALADDITQDTFVIAWRRLAELRDSRRLAPWLCGIARNLARDALKRNRREWIGETDEPMHTTTPYDQLSEAESERIIAEALGRVPDVYREPLVLHYYEERSVDEVARSLGISAATTNKRLSRGRQYLAESVAIVERGLVRHGPKPALAASVLAIIAVTAPSPHVDASPHVKGSTMNKLALSAIITAAVGGIGALVVTATRSDAHPQPPSTKRTPVVAQDSPHAFPHHGIASPVSTTTTRHPPSLAGVLGGGASAGIVESNDCGAVGRHLAELDADASAASANRPDEAACDECAQHYQARCEAQAWSDDRRNCTLAAADLINAHLCAGHVAPMNAAEPVPPSLSCKPLGAHIASVVQAAGLHSDEADLPAFIENACDVGAWPIELRQCFSAAASMDALQACIEPAH